MIARAESSRRLDAIVKLEAGLSSPSGLLAVGKAADVAVAVNPPTAGEAHNESKQRRGPPLREMLLQHAELARRLCRIYAVDYTCFGYPPPDICGKKPQF